MLTNLSGKVCTTLLLSLLMRLPDSAAMWMTMIGDHAIQALRNLLWGVVFQHHVQGLNKLLC
jgi:hypothetical protein